MTDQKTIDSLRELLTVAMVRYQELAETEQRVRGHLINIEKNKYAAYERAYSYWSAVKSLAGAEAAGEFKVWEPDEDGFKRGRDARGRDLLWDLDRVVQAVRERFHPDATSTT